MKSISVLLLDGETSVALPVARCLAHVPDLKLHVLSTDPGALIRFSRHKASYRVLQEGNDNGQRLDAIKQAIKQTNADIVLPIGEPAIRFVSDHCSPLKKLTALTHTPRLDIFDIVVNKWLLANFMKEYNIPHPLTILYTSDEKFEQELGMLSFPVLIKPMQGSEGRNIQYFDNSAALLDFLKGNQRFSNQYIVQSFIHGHDIDCSVLCRDGKILAYTIQKGFIPGLQRFAPPVGIEFANDWQTFDVVHRLMSTLEWSGIAHIDLRYDDQDKQVKVLEVNARYWTTLLGSLVVGVNFPYLACLDGLGVSFPRPSYHLKRFIRGNSAIIRGYLCKSKVNFTFKETSWRYVLADPLPEVISLIRKGWRTLSQSFGRR